MKICPRSQQAGPAGPLLELMGHRVEVAEDGLKGLEKALALRPDFALVDLGLPVLDGYEVARRLRADPRGVGIRLIALTGYGRPEDRRRTREAGFDEHLVKPLDVERLQGLLAALPGGSGHEGRSR